MKPIFVTLTLAALLLAPAVSRAQPADKAHQLSASELKARDWPSYKKGGKSQWNGGVRALQYLLRNRGFYRGKVDGVFGAQTEAAVRRFQRAKGLKADGIVGAQTWPLLVIRLKRGDKGDGVRALQILLQSYIDLDNEDGVDMKQVDGIFGASTLQNVRDYQEYNLQGSPKVNGIADARTWSVLLQL